MKRLFFGWLVAELRQINDKLDFIINQTDFGSGSV
jgi:hypothetical protein